MAGIVHFANFFRMMEETEHAFFRSLGSSIHEQGEDGAIGWPRVNVSCDFVQPLRFEEEIEIQLLVAEVRTRSIRYRFHFRKPDEATVAASGQMVVVCARVGNANGKLAAIAIPEKIRSAIQSAPPELLQLGSDDNKVS